MCGHECLSFPGPIPGAALGDINRPQAVMLYSGKNVKSRERSRSRHRRYRPPDAPQRARRSPLSARRSRPPSRACETTAAEKRANEVSEGRAIGFMAAIISGGEARWQGKLANCGHRHMRHRHPGLARHRPFSPQSLSYWLFVIPLHPVIPDLIRDPATARPRGERLFTYLHKTVFRLADARPLDPGSRPG